MFFVLAVAGFAVDDEVLPFFRKLIERDVGRDFKVAARTHQVGLAFGAHAAQPGLYDAFGEGF
jgi:hypothetical protein